MEADRTVLLAPGTDYPVEVDTATVDDLLQRGFRRPAAPEPEQSW